MGSNEQDLGAALVTNLLTCSSESSSKQGRGVINFGTSGVLLKSKDQPECINCNCPLTIKHVMLDMPRSKYYEVNNVQEFIESAVSATTILNYIQDIGSYRSISHNIHFSYQRHNKNGNFLTPSEEDETCHTKDILKWYFAP